MAVVTAATPAPEAAQAREARPGWAARQWVKRRCTQLTWHLVSRQRLDTAPTRRAQTQATISATLWPWLHYSTLPVLAALALDQGLRKGRTAALRTYLPAFLAIAPTAYGNLLLGEASEVVDHFSKESSAAGVKAIAEVAVRFLPGLRGTNIIRSWAAPVAFTIDGRPYLGPVDGLEGLLLAVAFKSTVVITPLIGRVITQLIVDGQAELDVTPFLLSRTAREQPSHISR
jgi:sarcosine oxidase subunit beta